MSLNSDGRCFKNHWPLTSSTKASRNSLTLQTLTNVFGPKLATNIKMLETKFCHKTFCMFSHRICNIYHIWEFRTLVFWILEPKHWVKHCLSKSNILSNVLAPNIGHCLQCEDGKTLKGILREKLRTAWMIMDWLTPQVRPMYLYMCFCFFL